MRTVTLSVIDRLLLPQLLPTQGGKIEMLLAGSITQTVEFTAAEITEFGMQDTGGTVTWANGRDVDFAFTPEQMELLKKASREVDEKKAITRQNLPLIEKIDSL